MKGDFTRLVFDPSKHYSLVFQQQGRVQLDSDTNEMSIIHLYLARALAADLIGPHGGGGTAFQIGPAKDEKGNAVNYDLAIGGGPYYVQGIRCETNQTNYSNQAASLEDLRKLDAGKDHVAYLDVWDRHVTAYEDENEERIGIREVALRGPDTTTRAQVIFRVRLRLLGETKAGDLDPKTSASYDNFLTFLGVKNVGRGRLRARAWKPLAQDEPCIISPEARYRGAENQLYRVEIHRGGVAQSGLRVFPPRQVEVKDISAEEINRTGSDSGIIVRPKPTPGTIDDTVATFKWSRENGSVVFPITELSGDTVTLRDLGRDSRFSLHPDDWVEIVDDDYTLQNRAQSLLQVKEVRRDSLQVILKQQPGKIDLTKHPLMRRWDQRSPLTSTDVAGTIPVVESTGDDDSSWITLEDGVQIQFPGPDKGAGGGATQATYRTGDYWLIPARVATGDVDWPGPPKNPRPQEPFGIMHAYAPLAIVSLDGNGVVKVGSDLRRTIKQLAE